MKFSFFQRLPEKIREKDEKLKEEMLGNYFSDVNLR